MKKIIIYLISLSFVVLLSTCTLQIPSSNKDGENNNPPTPNNLFPLDGDTSVSLTPQLSWACSGNNNNNVRFDVYLDTCNPPSYVITSGIYENYYIINSPLTAKKTYYWKIRAMTENGESCCNVCRFTTTGSSYTQGLLAYYPFNGNANDESGNSNNGQNFGAVLIPDRFSNSNKAYSFNGSNSHILVPNSSSLQPLNGLTLSSWVKLNNLNNSGSILAKGNETTIGFYSLWYESSGHTLSFQINFTDYLPGQELILSSVNAVQSNLWYNVIGTFDGSTMEIYLNGQFENSMYASLTMGSNTGDLMIGSCADAYFINGALDDIRIFDHKLSVSEIQELYHEGGMTKK